MPAGKAVDQNSELALVPCACRTVK